jgi:hypothetical protein
MPHSPADATTFLHRHFSRSVPKRPIAANKCSEWHEFFAQRAKIPIPPATNAKNSLCRRLGPLRDGSLSQLPQNCTLGLSASHPPACCRHTLWRSPRIASLGLGFGGPTARACGPMASTASPHRGAAARHAQAQMVDFGHVALPLPLATGPRTVTGVTLVNSLLRSTKQPSEKMRRARVDKNHDDHKDDRNRESMGTWVLLRRFVFFSFARQHCAYFFTFACRWEAMVYTLSATRQ